MDLWKIDPIGIIKTPWLTIENMPIQPGGAMDVIGVVEIFDEFLPGLKDIEGFSHIILLYKLHKIVDFQLNVIPFMDTEERGIFATRSPKRPNAIGISIVELLAVENNLLHIAGVDMLNETPLIDIKPFFEKFDNRFGTRQGWLKDKSESLIQSIKSDKRFI